LVRILLVQRSFLLLSDEEVVLGPNLELKNTMTTIEAIKTTTKDLSKWATWQSQHHRQDRVAARRDSRFDERAQRDTRCHVLVGIMYQDELI